MKQVVMGRLKDAEAFGEISVLDVEAITCSIVTASDIKLGVITQERLQGMLTALVLAFFQGPISQNC